MVIGIIGLVLETMSAKAIKKKIFILMPISFGVMLLVILIIFNINNELFEIIIYVVMQLLFGFIYSLSLIDYYNNIHLNIDSKQIGRALSITMIFRNVTSSIGSIIFTLIFIYVSWNMLIILYLILNYHCINNTSNIERKKQKCKN